MNHYSSHYESLIALGDFNIEVKHEEMKTFMEIFHLKNLIKVPTCFKSDNPKCIDLILIFFDFLMSGGNEFHSTIVNSFLSLENIC